VAAETFRVTNATGYSFINTTGSTPVLFGTAATERLRITAAGLVGVGTSTPVDKLTVAGATVNAAIFNTTPGTVVSPSFCKLNFYGYLADSNGNVASISAGNSQGNNYAGILRFATNAADGTHTTAVTIDGSQRVGIGNASPDSLLHVVDGAGNGIRVGFSSGTNNLNIYDATSHVFRNAGGGTERFRCDSSGRLLVGTSTARSVGAVTAPVEIEGTTYATSSLSITCNSTSVSPLINLGRSKGASLGSVTGGLVAGDDLGYITFGAADGSTLNSRAAWIQCQIDGATGTTDVPGRLVFSTTADGAASPTGRVRISSTGLFVAFSSNTDCFRIHTSAAAGTSDNLLLGRYGATGFDDGTETSIIIRSNGNVLNTNNSYGAISDLKLKENIVDANSQWDDLKALQVRNYNFKEGQTHTQIGLIAQEAELVSPGLVTESPDRDEEGNDLGTVTKSVNYSVLYMKAVKALQEAMERIETLEDRLTAAGL
jgi:hypothetical protein